MCKRFITSGIGVAYADGEFPGKNIFGETTGSNANTASGINSATFGDHTIASGWWATAFGDHTIASGWWSTTFGDNTIVSGGAATTFGFGTTAQPLDSFVIGRYNEISGTTNSWIDTDPLFVIGNGVDAGSPHNAVTVLKNGNVSIGNSSPDTPFSIIGNGGFYPVGITQNQIGAGSTMELTTKDGSSGQATRMLIRGNSNSADIEFYTGARGSEIEIMHIDGNGNVGIWTSTPNSKLEVTNGYFELDTSSGEPPSADCDNTDEIGRMKVDSSSSRFYICADGLGQGINWKTGALR